jgi:hypothetical protein
VSDEPVQVGTVVFTMVDPHRGHEVAFNRWYEQDHFYAGVMLGPWSIAGGRYVATRRLKDLRHPATNDITPDNQLQGTYLAIYWILDGHHDEWETWVVPATAWLFDNGRMWEERSHVHTNLYRPDWTVRRPGAPPLALAHDRHYPGLVVVVGDAADDATPDDVEAWFRVQYLPGAMRTRWGPQLVTNLRLRPSMDGVRAEFRRPPPTPRRFLQLHFVDGDPADGWAEGYARLAAEMDASGVATHVWTAPFIRTHFGTDDYTDELW